MNNWAVIFATAVIFGAGVVTGGLLVNHVQHSHPRNQKRMEAVAATNSVSQTNNPSQQAARPPRLPEILNKQFMQRLDEELHLTQDQREAIQKIITDGQNLMRKTMQDARLEIREQLTPEQQKQFDDLVKRPPRRPPNSTNAPVAEADFKTRLERIRTTTEEQIQKTKAEHLFVMTNLPQFTIPRPPVVLPPPPVTPGN